jgi:hypothetical protein
MESINDEEEQSLKNIYKKIQNANLVYKTNPFKLTQKRTVEVYKVQNPNPRQEISASSKSKDKNLVTEKRKVEIYKNQTSNVNMARDPITPTNYVGAKKITTIQYSTEFENSKKGLRDQKKVQTTMIYLYQIMN